MIQKISFHNLCQHKLKKEQVVSLMPAIKNAFDLKGYDIVELSTKNEYLMSQVGCYDEK